MTYTAALLVGVIIGYAANSNTVQDAVERGIDRMSLWIWRTKQKSKENSGTLEA